MKVDDLEAHFKASGIPSYAYSLRGGLHDETLCLEHLGDQWHIYYCEKGQKNTVDQYEKEEAACLRFREMIEGFWNREKGD